MSSVSSTVCTVPPSSQHAWRPESDPAFEARARRLLEYIADLPRPVHDAQRRLALHSIARLALDRQVERALADIAQINRDPGESWMFLWHANIDAWCRFSHRYTPELKALVRKRITSHDYRVRDGHTENHRLMIATAGYLAAQSFPDWEQSAEVLERSRRYLLDFFGRVRRFGQGEYSASTYGVFYLNTMGSLSDLAREPAMRSAAVEMLDRFLASLAGVWLDTRMVGAHSRDALPIFGKESPGAAEVALWLFLGGEFNGHAAEPHYAVINAIGSYRPPYVITRMGTDRSRPYEQLETHDLIEPEVRSHDGNDTREVKARGRFLKGFGYISRAGVRKYTYVTDRYALGCTYEGRQDDIIWTGQARRWSLDFVTPGPMGKCFFTHPLRDGQGIPRNYWKNWIGSSRYEQVLQHKSTLIAIYNIPRNGVHYAVHSQPMQADEFPFIDGFFGGFRLIRNDPSGWIFCHGGSALVAVRTLRPGQWLTRDDLLEHTLVGRCYRSNGHRNAVVMEVEPSRLDGDVREQQMEAELTAFAGEILASSRIDGSAMEAERPSLVCVDRRGTRLELEYDGARRIDGEELDFESWPLLSNPWVHAEVGDGELHWRMPERQVME